MKRNSIIPRIYEYQRIGGHKNKLLIMQAAILLSLVNGGNLVGRIIMGGIVDLPWLRYVYYHKRN